MYKNTVINENQAMKKITTEIQGGAAVVRVRQEETDQELIAEAVKLAEDGISLLVFPNQALMDQWRLRRAALA